MHKVMWGAADDAFETQGARLPQMIPWMKSLAFQDALLSLTAQLMLGSALNKQDE